MIASSRSEVVAIVAWPPSLAMTVGFGSRGQSRHTLDGSSYIARQGDGTAGHKGPKRRTGTPWPRRRDRPPREEISSRRLTRAERDQGVAVRMTNGRVTIRPVQLGLQRLAFGADAARQKTAVTLAALAMQKHKSLLFETVEIDTTDFAVATAVFGHESPQQLVLSGTEHGRNWAK